MSIIDELLSGTVKFTVQEDGTETIERRPPTSLAIRAANTIKSLAEQLEGLNRVNQTLFTQYNQNLAELEKLNAQRSVVQEHVATEGVDSVRPVHGESEGPGSKEET
jgi:chromosome segregation ATPase